MRNWTLLLPFGKARAATHVSDGEFLRALRGLGQPVGDLTFTGAESGAATAGLAVGELRVTAFCAAPFQARCIAEPQLAFTLPVSGSGAITDGSGPLAWKAGKTIISDSYHEPLLISAGICAAVILRPSLAKLVGAMRSALADGDGPVRADADEIGARLLVRGSFLDDGQAWSMDYFSALMKAVAMIDDGRCDGGLLSWIGLEDVINRLLARLVLEQEHGTAVASPPPVQPRSVRAVDLICDRIRSTIGRPMSISEMEELTGLSGRALNYAFRARFQCSPQEWQRNFLLDHARQMLKGTHYTGSVKALSYELGFSSPSSFAAHYRQRFGERPSVSRGARSDHKDSQAASDKQGLTAPQ